MFYKCFTCFTKLMITLKIVIRPERQKKDGTWNVNIRISYKRSTAYVATPYFVVKQQLNKDYSIKDVFLLTQTSDELQRARKIVTSSFDKICNMTASEISEFLQTQLYNKQTKSLNFIEFAEATLDEWESFGKASVNNYKITLRKILAFCGNRNLTFDQITPGFLSDFDKWLNLNGTGSRGRALYFSNLRSLFNTAIKHYNDEYNDVVLIRKNPFKYFTIPESSEPAKRALTLEQMKALINYQPEKETVQLGKDVFLLSFYLVGINSKDLFNLTKIDHGRITYNRSKTKAQRKDNARISIKIEQPAMDIIQKYLDTSGERLLSFHQRYSTAQNFNKYINEYLKTIGKAIGVEDLQYYAARHTWATLFVNECEGSESEAAFCLNHVSEHKVTSGYIQKDFARIDRANQKVLNLL